MAGYAKAAETADVVTGDGTISVLRYGGILQARQLVGVRGAGLAFDGLYYVDSTKHQIKLGEYKQSFTLKRNALVSNVPMVPTLRHIRSLEGKAYEPILGKYRGTVVNNVDPQNMGRLSVTVPDVSNVQTSTWAMPSAALAGSLSPACSRPPVGANVWVEFEQGNSDYPIWSGASGARAAEVPPQAISAPPGVQSIVMQSVGGTS